MIEYGKINSEIISDAKYILLFHISSYVRYVFLNRCQLKEIDSTYIILEGKSNFVKKRFCQICEKSRGIGYKWLPFSDSAQRSI